MKKKYPKANVTASMRSLASPLLRFGLRTAWQLLLKGLEEVKVDGPTKIHLSCNKLYAAILLLPADPPIGVNDPTLFNSGVCCVFVWLESLRQDSPQMCDERHHPFSVSEPNHEYQISHTLASNISRLLGQSTSGMIQFGALWEKGQGTSHALNGYEPFLQPCMLRELMTSTSSSVSSTFNLQ